MRTRRATEARCRRRRAEAVGEVGAARVEQDQRERILSSAPYVPVSSSSRSRNVAGISVQAVVGRDDAGVGEEGRAA